jgi:hypothetical protein
MKLFTTTLGQIDLFLPPFELKPLHNFNGMSFCCSFQIVLKLPCDLTGSSAAMSKFLTDELSDVKIICDDQIFKCHKLILARNSDVFKAMFFSMNNCTE